MSTFEITLKQASLAALAKSAAKRSGHHTLQNVHITPQYVEASNGHICVRLAHGESQRKPAAEYSLPYSDIEAMAKAAKAQRHPGIDLQNGGGSNVLTTIGNQPFTSTASNCDYPNVDAITPTSAPTYRISLGADALELLIEAMRKCVDNKHPAFVFEFRGPLDPVVVTSDYVGGLTALLMPYKSVNPEAMGIQLEAAQRAVDEAKMGASNDIRNL